MLEIRDCVRQWFHEMRVLLTSLLSGAAQTIGNDILDLRVPEYALRCTVPIEMSSLALWNWKAFREEIKACLDCSESSISGQNFLVWQHRYKTWFGRVVKASSGGLLCQDYCQPLLWTMFMILYYEKVLRT
jgi:hypothetical protein